MIRKLSDADFLPIYNIVNEAAVAYKGKIPSDCYHEPYMPKEELQAEIEAGVQFYGITTDGELAAVMGIQPIGDVTLIRHAYTETKYQRQGLGEQLLNHLINLAETDQVLIGTWTDATCAIKFYQKHGFNLLSREETNKLLNKYWHITQRQVETSVVLEQWRKP